MLYAKSNPKESIENHTKELLDRLEVLQEDYGEKILQGKAIEKGNFWRLLQLACKYHDTGKVYTPFQNMIKQKIGETTEQTELNNTIKHEEISPLLIPHEELVKLQKQEKEILYQAIYYHHERDRLPLDKNIIQKIIEKDIKPRVQDLEKELKILLNKQPTNAYLGYVGEEKRIKENNVSYIEYCLLKGLLHRLDYSASAHTKIEDSTTDKINQHIEKVMKRKAYKENDLQKYCKKNNNENVIVIGSTGMGKTEAGLLWSNGDKTFFTLPLRISINAIYDRIAEEYQYQQYTGLLHSTALDYLESKNEEDDENYYLQYEEARNLSKKITTCTIDQIFTFVFKYAGYERVYATLAYSKIIIDEIQAYSPEIVAVILKGLEKIHKIGGTFLIMTATLPRIYKEKLVEMGIPFKENRFLSSVQRHKIKIQKQEITQDIEHIIEKARDKKVLIIVNTIEKAIEMYHAIEKKINQVYVLHSRFTQIDREEKEKNIKKFANNKEAKGIWITTQIVEASIDIDFDYLYTEMSTLDSLFQRLGRCYRKREWTENQCNVYIYTEKISGIGKIYDEEIYKTSVELLKKYDEKVLTEEEKVELVDILYSEELLKGTEFLKRFQKGTEVLNNIIDYKTSKKDAQEMLRDIQNIDVIPKAVYDENKVLFENYKKEIKKEEKRKIRKQIEKLTVSISIRQCQMLKNKLFKTELDNITGIDTKYSKEEGLILKQNIEDDIDSRMF